MQYQLFPELTPDEFQALKDDIRQRGVIVAVELDESGNILDGHHRIKAWQELKSEGVNLPDYPRMIRKFANEAEKRNHVRALNILRRHLSKEQQRDQWLQMRQDGMTYQAIADVSGVSKPTVMGAVKNSVGRNLPTEITGKDGKQYPAEKRPQSAPQVSIFATSDNQQKQAIKAAPSIEGGISVSAVGKEVQQVQRNERRAERINNIIEAVSNNKPLDGIGKFSVIYADPPWQYDFPVSDSRAIENQYPTMTIDDICALPVSDIAADDAIIFLWVTTPFLKKGLRVLDEWGFDYRTSMVWVKPSIGPGQWVRQRHEYILIGVKGNIPTPAVPDKPDSVIEADRAGHSEKPDVVYSIIEKMYPELGKVELFCRNPRDGWVVWGNQS